MMAKMLDLLFGCHHRVLTWPITPVHKPNTQASDTYVACLECGRQFYYDTGNMRVGMPMPATGLTPQHDAYLFQSQQ
jgi:hypothetical protein